MKHRKWILQFIRWLNYVRISLRGCVFMKKFKFTLQTLMDVKLAKKKQLLSELSIQLEYLEQQQNVLDGLNRKKEESVQNMYEFASDGATINLLRAYSDFNAMIEKDISVQYEKIEHTEGQIKAIREKLIDLFKEIDMLKDLKDRQYVEFCQQMDKREAAIIDELLTYKVGQGGRTYE